MYSPLNDESHCEREESRASLTRQQIGNVSPTHTHKKRETLLCEEETFSDHEMEKRIFAIFHTSPYTTIATNLLMPRQSSFTRSFRSSQRFFGAKEPLARHLWTGSPPGSPSNGNSKERKEGQPQHLQQYRSFHGTVHREFAPFLPEIIVGAGIGVGWVLYRTTQGKPLTPDQALESQKAYQKLQRDLERRNRKYATGSMNFTSKSTSN
eukprot:scaffold4582_cov166-Amphora_coffeaeformis.AAC.5